MCELLGMSANVPTDICFSFQGLMRRGGATGPHRDGWGIAFYEGAGVRDFRDPDPGSESEVAQFVQRYPIKSLTVISHIRQANVGKVALENTHPFIRELWGRYWSYAHNGQLSHFNDLNPSRFLPVGNTDSERAFCWLLDRLAAEFSPTQVGEVAFQQLLKSLCDELATRGVFNMLLTDGHWLFAYCSTKLSWITRRAPFGVATLADEELSVDFGQETTPDDIVTVIATTPLTLDERWEIMRAGEMAVFRDGLVQAQLASVTAPSPSR